MKFRTCDHHEALHRTQSEEPSKSPFESGAGNQHNKSVFAHLDSQSRASSRQSDFDSQESFGHIFCAPNHSECIDFMEKITNRVYESNSLPRRKCIHHSDEYQTNSLPRKDATQQLRDSFESGDVSVPSLTHFRAHGTFSLESTMGSNQNIVEAVKRRYSCGVQESLRRMNNENDYSAQKLVRRNSTNNFYRPQTPDDYEDDENDENDDEQYGEDDDDDGDIESDEYCSTCESETDESKQEKEIFIDFKPRLSPASSPRGRKQRLQKTLSEGEILIEKRRESNAREEILPLTSASEEDLVSKECQAESDYLYRNAPIKDEGICHKNNLLKLPTEHDASIRQRREAFRKRSISLEGPAVDELNDNEVSSARKATAKSGPPSPCFIGKSDKDISTFPSSDSLSADLTRDHSDGNWNESQATVLQVEQR